MAVAAVTDPSVWRFLYAHEARVHAFPGRVVRDLGDGVLLHDVNDPEPFWNRLVAPTWPADPRAFDDRLDEVITLFATIDRIPHVWTLPVGNSPSDIVDRFRSAGFVSMGEDAVMLLDDPGPAPAAALAALAGSPGQDVTVERIDGGETGRRRAADVRAAADLALVLADAFDVDPDRRAAIEIETMAALNEAVIHACLIRVDGEPAAAAKRTTFDGASYLSSIGTRPAFRGRGLGRIATAVVTADAIADGSRWTYLGVHADNHTARHLYERLGFVVVGGTIPDLILRH